MKLLLTSKKWIGILICITVLGLFLRVYDLGKLSFNADEFLDINASYGYAMTKTWQAWDFNFQKSSDRINIASDERAWPYRYQVAQMLRFFEPTEFIARSVSVIWGVITIVLMFFIARSMTGSVRIGLISAFLFSVSASGIEFDRTLRMYAMFFPIFLLFSWTVFRLLEPNGKYPGIFRFFEKKLGYQWDIRFFVPAVILGVLSFYVHQLTANIIFIVLAYNVFWAGVIFCNKKTIKTKYTFLFLVGIFFSVLGSIFFPEQLTRQFGALIFFENHWSYFGKILSDYSHPLIAVGLFGLGIYSLWVRKRQKESVWLSISSLSLLFFAVFLWRRNVGPQYIFFAQSFVIILIASGISHVVDVCVQTFSSRYLMLSRVVVVTLACMLLIVPNYAYFFEENTSYRQSSEAGSPDYRSTFSYFLKNKQEGDVLITRDFRSYYFHDAKVQVYDFGGELSRQNFSLENLEEIMRRHKHGWVIYSDNDERYIAKNTRYFIEDNLEKIRDQKVRGNMRMYRW